LTFLTKSLLCFVSFAVLEEIISKDVLMDPTTRVTVSQTVTVWVSTEAVRVRLAMATRQAAFDANTF